MKKNNKILDYNPKNDINLKFYFEKKQERKRNNSVLQVKL
jgi:hypothetical protein